MDEKTVFWLPYHQWEDNMGKTLKRMIRAIFASSGKKNTKSNNSASSNPMDISKKLSHNLKILKDLADKSGDINFRPFKITDGNIDCLLINIAGISDKAMINKSILGALMAETQTLEKTDVSIDSIKQKILSVHDVKNASTFNDISDGILSGDTVFLMDGHSSALIINTRSYEHRGVEAPETEALVRGPRSGFTEMLQMNTALVRQIIKSFDLVMETSPVGKRTKTDVCLVYIKSIANQKIVDNVRKKLGGIDIDAVLESEYIEEIIDSNPKSIFPTVGITESPSRFASKILEGRVGLIVDGTPFALTIPHLFVEAFQSMEDYYSHPIFATCMRLLRYTAFHLTLFLPGFYIALQAFHPAVIPTKLLISMAAAQEGLPFPLFVETLLMQMFFEGLREAGVRMPRPVGQAVSIVGALVLGEAAVSAGLVSPVVVIIVAITGITSFLMPTQMDTVLLLRFPIIIVAGFLGLVGVFWSYILLVVYLASISTFDVPYLAPIAPFDPKDMKDTFVRLSWRKMNTRPVSLATKDKMRQSSRGTNA
jgi:spore germination protein KA